MARAFQLGKGILDKNPNKWSKRLVIGTPTTGLIRMEWVNGRYGQTIPTNWSHVDVQQFMSPYTPINYQIADAENLIAKVVVENNFEWLLSYEHDNIPPANAFVKMNEYMIKGDIPMVAGLYFTKSVPPEPMIYRERGMGYYADWKYGDKVWARGVPFGFTLIHGNIIREIWKDAPEYVVNGTVTRRVFDTPSESSIDPETGGWIANSGTSDLEFCNRLIEKGYLARAGFPEIQKKEYPFLVDTSIFVEHIDNEGVRFPINLPLPFWEKKITYKDALRLMTM